MHCALGCICPGVPNQQPLCRLMVVTHFARHCSAGCRDCTPSSKTFIRIRAACSCRPMMRSGSLSKTDCVISGRCESRHSRIAWRPVKGESRSQFIPNSYCEMNQLIRKKLGTIAAISLKKVCFRDPFYSAKKHLMFYTLWSSGCFSFFAECHAQS